VNALQKKYRARLLYFCTPPFFFSGDASNDTEMDATSERTLANLIVIGTLSDNDKLRTASDLFYIYQPTTLRAIFRSMYGENRASDLSRIKEVVTSGLELAARYQGRAKMRMCQGLWMARAGLMRLRQTYQHDATTVAQIQMLIANVDDFWGEESGHPPPPPTPSSFKSPSASECYSLQEC
jgi:hypothetical protein